MASIKKSEIRLLVAFCVLIICAISVFVLDIVNGKKQEAIGLQNARKNKIVEYNDLIRDREQWQVKKDFVQRYQPAFRTEEEEAPALEAYFRRNADAHGLEIKKLVPLPPEPLGDTMMAVSLSAQLSGLGADALQFLISLQAETRFYAIPSIQIAADRKDPTIIILDMTFSCWFTLEGELPTTELPEEDTPVPTVAKFPIGEPAVEPASVEPADQPAADPPALIADPANPDAQPETEPVVTGAKEETN